MKTMKLAHGVPRGDDASDAVRDYKVLVVKNSTAYHPGQILNEVQVRELCGLNNWDITIVPLLPKDGTS